MTRIARPLTAPPRCSEAFSGGGRHTQFRLDTHLTSLGTAIRAEMRRGLTASNPLLKKRGGNHYRESEKSLPEEKSSQPERCGDDRVWWGVQHECCGDDRGWILGWGGDIRHHFSPSKSSRAAASSFRRFLGTLGKWRCKESSASMMAPATTTRVYHLLSAGTTYQGA